MTPRERRGWLIVPVLFVILAIIVGCINSMGVLYRCSSTSDGAALGHPR
jgi:hypothetical protein